MKYYCGIGSRETPEDVLERMTKLATILERKGYVLRSGGAIGADKAFEKGCECSEIFLPEDEIPLWCEIFTDHFHPAPNKLKEFPRKLMNRNAMQILGRDGNTPVEFVVCWTKNGKQIGGTAQALKIAEYFNIPIFNFALEDDVETLKNMVKRIEDA